MKTYQPEIVQTEFTTPIENIQYICKNIPKQRIFINGLNKFLEYNIKIKTL
jgi:hypothetical protein